MSRIIFFAVVSTGVLAITTLGMWLGLRFLRVEQKKCWLWRNALAWALVLVSLYYYQEYAFAGDGTWWKTIWQGVSVELNGLIVAAVATTAAYLLMFLLSIPWKLWEKEKERRLKQSVRGRRTFLKVAGGLIPTLFGITALVSAFKGAHEVVVTHHELAFDDLPEELEDYKIVQLTDVHIGGFINVKDLEEMLVMAKAEEPHRVVITGDLIDDLRYLPELQELLSHWVHEFEHGIDYILGNHEYIRSVDTIIKALKDTGIHMYRNSSRQIGWGRRPVHMIGVDYNFKHDVAWNNKFLDQAMEDVPKDSFVILLAHHPSFIQQAFERGIPLTLTGHTHGAQITLWGMNLVPVAKPYWKGMYEHNGHYGYVSNGSGHWFPVRLNCPREVTVFTLKRKP